MNDLLYVCSPYRGDTKRNKEEEKTNNIRVRQLHQINASRRAIGWASGIRKQQPGRVEHALPMLRRIATAGLVKCGF